jgi:hypothetical protein
MNMIAHQHVGVQGHPVLSRVFVDQAQQQLVVGSVPEDDLAIVAALDDVMQVARKRESGKARHRFIIGGPDPDFPDPRGAGSRRNQEGSPGKRRVSSSAIPNSARIARSRSTQLRLRCPVHRARISSFFNECSHPTSSVTVTW